jgi:hypothetical protein
MVTASGVWQRLSIAWHDQWNDREMQLHRVSDGAGQSLSPFIADHSKEISGCGNSDRHTGRDHL